MTGLHLPYKFLLASLLTVFAAQGAWAQQQTADTALRRTGAQAGKPGKANPPAKRPTISPIKYEQRLEGWHLLSDSAGMPSFRRGDEPLDRFTPYKITDNPANSLWTRYAGPTGANGPVYAIGYFRDEVFVGGDFTLIGGIQAKNIARWNARTGRWAALERGTNAPVYSIAITNDTVYVGGAFTRAGDWAANYIAWWDASAERWTELGTGLNHWVYSVAADGRGNVYAGGLFSRAGDTAAGHIARWDGKRWLPLGPGLDKWVYAVTAFGDHVYAGGGFKMAGDIPVNNVAEYHTDTGVWEPMSDGTDGIVYTMISDSLGDVYAGGQFSSADSVYANNVAKWNCSNRSWTGFPVGVLLNPCPVFVSSIALRGGHMYIGGRFYITDSATANATYMAEWNGRRWYTYGDGVNDDVYAVQPTPYGVFVGGRFAMAGGMASWGFAQTGNSQTTAGKSAQDPEQDAGQ